MKKNEKVSSPIETGTAESGIDKIIKSLDEQTENDCKRVLQKARDDASSKSDAIVDDAREKAEKILADAKKQAEQIVSLAKTGSDMAIRQAELTRKVNLLNNVLADTKRRFDELDDKEYFGVLLNIITANAQSGNGEILMSEKDFSRMPEDFESEVNEKISPDGKRLTVKKSPEVTECGVILSYGDIEMNLLFSSLIESFKDELKATAQKVLFK